MFEKIVIAGQGLKTILENDGFCVWDVNERSLTHKLGLLFGVTLDWPGKSAMDEVARLRARLEVVALEQKLIAAVEGPVFAAGGVYVVYCGFRSPLFSLAILKSKEQNKPIWKICEEDPELIAMTR